MGHPQLRCRGEESRSFDSAGKAACAQDDSGKKKQIPRGLTSMVRLREGPIKQKLPLRYVSITAFARAGEDEDSGKHLT